MIKEDREIGEDIFTALHLVPEDEVVCSIYGENNIVNQLGGLAICGIREITVDTMCLDGTEKSYQLVMKPDGKHGLCLRTMSCAKKT